jgi:hypothetical protein
MKKLIWKTLTILCVSITLLLGFTACGEMFQVHVHFYDATVTKATCTTEGYTTYTCECGDMY